MAELAELRFLSPIGTWTRLWTGREVWDHGTVRKTAAWFPPLRRFTRQRNPDASRVVSCGCISERQRATGLVKGRHYCFHRRQKPHAVWEASRFEISREEYRPRRLWSRWVPISNPGNGDKRGSGKPVTRNRQQPSDFAGASIVDLPLCPCGSTGWPETTEIVSSCWFRACG